MTFESILNAVGGFGKYQKLLCFYFVLSSIPNGYLVLSIVFVGMTPSHRCCIPEIEDCSNRSSGTKYHLPNATLDLYIPIDGENGRLSECKIYGENSTTRECSSGWVYDTEFDRSTFVTEWDLVCGRASFRPLITAIFMAGVLVGSGVSGIFADRFGRRPVFLGGTYAMFIFFGLCGAAPSPIVYLVTMFFAGASNLINFAVAFVLCSEVINTNNRMVTGTLTIAGFSIGYMIIPLVAYFITNWRMLYLAIGLTGILFLPYFMVIDESPSWLYSKGRFEEFWKVIRKIGTMNAVPNSEIDLMFTKWLAENKESGCLLAEQQKKPVTVNNRDICQTKQADGNWTILFIHLKQKLVFVSLLNMCLTWFSASVIYYGLSLNTSNLGGNPYVNCFISAAVEVPAYILVIILLKRIGRKAFVFWTLLLSGIFCGAVPYIDNFSTEGAIASGMVGKFMISGCFAVIYIYCAELFPTLLRSTAVGTCSMSARIGAVVAPYLLYAGETYSSLPYIIMLSLALVSVIFLLWLPETGRKALPETWTDMTRLKLSVRELFVIHKLDHFEDQFGQMDSLHNKPKDNA